MLKKNLIVLSAIVLFSLPVLYFIKNPVSPSSSSHYSSPKNIDEHYILVGTDRALYKYFPNHKIHQIWHDAIKKILKTPYGLFILTQKGIIFSKNASSFTPRNKGIYQQVIKDYSNSGRVSYIKQAESLKDIAYDINNPDNLAVASKKGIYVSQNRGLFWKFYKTPSRAPNIKSVAIYSYKDSLNIFLGHPFEGVYFLNIAKPSSKWKRIYAGLKTKGGYREEVSSLAVIPNKPNRPILLAGQNFQPCIYKLQWNSKYWTPYIPLKSPSNKVSILDSLFVVNKNTLLFTTKNKINIYDSKTRQFKEFLPITQFVKKFNTLLPNERISTVANMHKNNLEYSVNELWLLQTPSLDKNKQKAYNKRGVYSQADVFKIPQRLSQLIRLLDNTHMNMVTVDMKDDYGNLRFQPKDPFILKMAQGHILSPVNLEKTLPLLKSHGIYLVARIPVFKDKVLHFYNNYELSVKNKNKLTPWMGIRSYRKNGSIRYNKEFWVDPYNPKIWDYNARIANELLKKGFDEIQFDYIRFPTDGKNLSQAYYPSKHEGMNKDSALISFLRYMRKNIDAPISIDIYGANGWLRTSARTGQDVEMLDDFIDVIAPMYYPSHFGINFLNYPPYEDRPYRIYYTGSLRNYYIARQKVIIRPYVQAFRLSFNPYDKKYYNQNYIDSELLGIHDSINMGFTFWNSATRYSILNSSVLTKKSFD